MSPEGHICDFNSRPIFASKKLYQLKNLWICVLWEIQTFVRKLSLLIEIFIFSCVRVWSKIVVYNGFTWWFLKAWVPAWYLKRNPLFCFEQTLSAPYLKTKPCVSGSDWESSFQVFLIQWFIVWTTLEFKSQVWQQLTIVLVIAQKKDDSLYLVWWHHVKCRLLKGCSRAQA